MNATNPDELTRFVVLFEGRSGSTYLIESLASHPQIRAEKEILATLKQRVDRGTAEPNAQLRAVEELFAPGQHEYNVVGFKTKLKDILDWENLAEVLQKLDTRIILLQRRNRIKLLVSLMNAMQLNEATGDWNLYNESDRQPMIHIDVGEFKQWLDRTEQSNAYLNSYARQLQLPLFEVFYEDIFENAGETFERTCQFLDVPYRSLRGSCIKNTSDDLREVVENFDELKAAFAGTQYEDMFAGADLIYDRTMNAKVGRQSESE